jgi:hypothetical protein
MLCSFGRSLLIAQLVKGGLELGVEEMESRVVTWISMRLNNEVRIGAAESSIQRIDEQK